MSAGKLLAVKAAVIVTALSSGGVALAASTGHMTSHSGGHDSAASTASASPSASSDHSRHTPNGTPSPSMHGLCHAYTSGAGSRHGKNLDNPAFTALINAAGGKGNVSSYCATVLESAQHGKSGSHASGKASAHSSATSRRIMISIPSMSRMCGATSPAPSCATSK